MDQNHVRRGQEESRSRPHDCEWTSPRVGPAACGRASTAWRWAGPTLRGPRSQSGRVSTAACAWTHVRARWAGGAARRSQRRAHVGSEPHRSPHNHAAVAVAVAGRFTEPGEGAVAHRPACLPELAQHCPSHPEPLAWSKVRRNPGRQYEPTWTVSRHGTERRVTTLDAVPVRLALTGATAYTHAGL